MDLHFQTYGQGDPVIILHGLFGSLENWQGISKRLGEGFRVLAVDLRNHGQSPHSPEMNYQVMAEDMRNFMRAQGLSTAHLLGHSLGGKTAMQFALSHPENVRKLIVVDIGPLSYPPWHRPILDALLALDLTGFQNRQQVEQALAPAIPETKVRQFLLKNLTRAAGGALRWRIDLQSISRQYDRLNEALPAESSFDHPALFIRGEDSEYLPMEESGSIRRLFPKAEFRTVPGAGHWVHAENPEAFLRLVRAFL